MARFRAAIAACVAAVLLGGWVGGSPARTRRAIVEQVIDGDTIAVRFSTNERALVRLVGVDTPETRHPDRPVECFGPEASAYTTALLEDEQVQVYIAREPVDRYGRLLAEVKLSGVSVNEELLRNGYARLLIIPPNDSKARRYLGLELDARAKGAGLWGSC